jgi:hypothetical protein
VPDIPVIHSFGSSFFAFATRTRGAWSLGDRDGGPGLSRSRQRQVDAAGDQRSDLRRQDWEEPSGSYRASREEAPEESIFLERDAVPGGLRIVGEQSGTQEWSIQEGPRNTGRFWLRGISVPDAGPGRAKDQRTFGPRSRVGRSGSSQEGVVRWEATPELVSQDRERVRLGRKAEVDQAQEYRQILRSAQWGLAAMPAPISLGGSDSRIGATTPARSFQRTATPIQRGGR